MNTENITPEHTPRPFGFWLRAVDRLLAREFETAFEAEGITRRDWRILSVLAGDVASPELVARLQRGGGKKLRALIERGWVVETDSSWALTDEGRAAQARLAEIAAGIHSKVSGAVSEADFATTMATLEAVARELGGDESERMPRGPHRGHGFGGHRFGGRGHGGPFEGEFPGGRVGAFGPRRRGCDTHAGDHGAPGRHGGHGPRHAERAFERGFTAGFAAAGTPGDNA